MAALRRLALGLLKERHPLSGLRDGTQGFWKIVEESPTLLSRACELRDELEHSLTQVLAQQAGSDPEDLRPRLTAASVVAAFVLIHASAQLGLRAGKSSASIFPGLVVQVNALFDQIEFGVDCCPAAGSVHVCAQA